MVQMLPRVPPGVSSWPSIRFSYFSGENSVFFTGSRRCGEKSVFFALFPIFFFWLFSGKRKSEFILKSTHIHFITLLFVPRVKCNGNQLLLSSFIYLHIYFKPLHIKASYAHNLQKQEVYIDCTEAGIRRINTGIRSSEVQKGCSDGKFKRLCVFACPHVCMSKYLSVRMSAFMFSCGNVHMCEPVFLYLCVCVSVYSQGSLQRVLRI